MAYDLMNDIVQKTLAGISEAQKKYEYWTGGRWLWEAPEYMVTTYIAKHIADIEDKTFYLTLEHKVRDAIKAARNNGKLPVGQPLKHLRLKGKFDVLVWWANDTPRAVIEVKKKVARFSDIEADVSRICAILNIPDTSFRCGFIAYYTSKYDKHGLAKDLVNDRVKEVAKDVKLFANQNGMKFKRYSGKVKGDDSDAWTVEVLKISK